MINRIGRSPRKNSRRTDVRKDVRFQMMMTPQEVSELEAIAEHAKISVAEAVRRLCRIAIDTQEAKRRQLQMLSGKEVGGIHDLIRDMYEERAA